MLRTTRASNYFKCGEADTVNTGIHFFLLQVQAHFKMILNLFLEDW